MPSWPEQTKYISHVTTRIDAPEKVTGRAHYSSDIQANGWLYGTILRSKWPAATISAINLDKALKIPGIKAAITAKDLPQNVRFYGEEIAAVCGTTKQACLDALRAIEVTAQPRQFVVHEDDAMKDGAPQVWDGRPNAAPGRPREQGLWIKPSPNAPPSLKDFTPRQCSFTTRWKPTAAPFPGRTRA